MARREFEVVAWSNGGTGYGLKMSAPHDGAKSPILFITSDMSIYRVRRVEQA
jgi:hypothetical protein